MINLYLSDLQHMDMEDVVADILSEYIKLSQEVKTLRENRRTVQHQYMQQIRREGNLDTDFTNLLGITEVQHDNTSTFYVDGMEYTNMYTKPHNEDEDLII